MYLFKVSLLTSAVLASTAIAQMPSLDVGDAAAVKNTPKGTTLCDPYGVAFWGGGNVSGSNAQMQVQVPQRMPADQEIGQLYAYFGPVLPIDRSVSNVGTDRPDIGVMISADSTSGNRPYARFFALLQMVHGYRILPQSLAQLTWDIEIKKNSSGRILSYQTQRVTAALKQGVGPGQRWLDVDRGKLFREEKIPFMAMTFAAGATLELSRRLLRDQGQRPVEKYCIRQARTAFVPFKEVCVGFVLDESMIPKDHLRDLGSLPVAAVRAATVRGALLQGQNICSALKQAGTLYAWQNAALSTLPEQLRAGDPFEFLKRKKRK